MGGAAKKIHRTIYMPFTVFCGANFVTAVCCLFFLKQRRLCYEVRISLPPNAGRLAENEM
jgi:hypothetical protein